MSHVPANKDIHIHMSSSSSPVSDPENIHNNMEEYVVYQNKLLSAQITNISTENLNMRKVNEELEKDVDRLNSSLKYLKGIVKNFEEINNLENAINKKKYAHVEVSQKLILSFLSVYSQCSFFLFCILSCMSLINFVQYEAYIYAFLLMIVGNGSVVLQEVIVVSKIKGYILPSETEKKNLKAMEDQLSALKKSQNFLSEYIDNI